MPRGGYRASSGRASSWKHGKTRTIRVPEAFANQLLEIARELDKGEALTLQRECIIDSVTESKVLDLSGVSIRQTNGVISVYLEDLVKAGYEIRPPNLAEMVKARINRNLEQKGIKLYGSDPRKRR